MSRNESNKLVADPGLLRRIDEMALRTHKDKTDVFNNALRSGLEWQEDFVDRIQRGIEAAEQEEFASSQEVERVFNKYRPS